MARPKGSGATRAALIQVGMDQLSVVGYHGTGIKQILDVMKVPKGSFYNYFASKEAFVAEVVEEFGRQLLQELDESISNSQLGDRYTRTGHHNCVACGTPINDRRRSYPAN